METHTETISRESVQRQFNFFVQLYRRDKADFQSAKTQDEIIKANNSLMINGSCAIVLAGLLGLNKEQIQTELGDI